MWAQAAAGAACGSAGAPPAHQLPQVVGNAFVQDKLLQRLGLVLLLCKQMGLQLRGCAVVVVVDGGAVQHTQGAMHKGGLSCQAARTDRSQRRRQGVYILTQPIDALSYGIRALQLRRKRDGRLDVRASLSRATPCPPKAPWLQFLLPSLKLYR